MRAFFLGNIVHWMRNFHVDGFRLDATHAIWDDSTPHILAELAETVRERGGFTIAEDERNESQLIAPVAKGGCGLDAVWADDFHHTVENALIDASMYAEFFTGDLDEIAVTLREGWTYRGEARRGGECGPARLVSTSPPSSLSTAFPITINAATARLASG